MVDQEIYPGVSSQVFTSLLGFCLYLLLLSHTRSQYIPYIQYTHDMRPITFILPYGEMIDDDEQIKRTDVEWVVAIYGGESYNTEAAYYYVDRQNPASTLQQTFDLMKQRFIP